MSFGGVYGDKTAAISRFIQQYRSLDDNIKQRLVIENDDKQYNISDVYSIGNSEGIPVVFDNLHHKLNPDNTNSETEWISICESTWKQPDGPQKLHYSQQAPDKRPGSHSSTIDMSEFQQFCKNISKSDVDIMIEVKDKNLSAVKCINSISTSKIEHLEKEWARYKYLVLEHSPKIYNDIRQLLKDKNQYPVLEFYRLIDEAVVTPVKPGNAVNAAEHIWGYFKDIADQKIKKNFQKNITKISSGESTIPTKRLLWKLANEFEELYLLNSLYFIELS